MRRKSASGIVVLDNSYNTNKEGFAASIDYLKLYPGRKFVVTPGIIELGAMTAEVHRELGKKLTGIEKVWVSRKGVEKWFEESGARVEMISDQVKLAEKISGEMKNGDVLLIEGRISPVLKKRLANI